MLQNNKNILWKLFCIGTAMMISGPALCAGRRNLSISNKINNAWDGLKISGIKRANSEVLLGGCVESVCPGTSSSGGNITQSPVIVNMARKINANGAYFCPTQVELEIYTYGNNDSYGYVSGFSYYKPNTTISCRWICKDGHKGDNCEETDDGSNPGSLSMKLLKGNITPTANTENIISEPVDVVDAGVFDSARSWVRVLAIFKYLEHGVHVGSLWIYGTSKGYATESYIYRLDTEADGQTYNGTTNGDYILCDEGYKVNAAKNDCELMQSGVVLKEWCDGWSEDQFKAQEGSVQYFVTADDCRKFKCTDTSKGFSSESSRTCEPCANAGGVDANGVCQSCPVGQTYKNGGCVSMRAFNKRQMQFGPNGAPVGKSSDACWTKTDLTEYKQCVFGN